MAAMDGFPDTLFVTRKWGPAIGGMETWSERLSEELGQLGPIEVVALPGRANGLPPTGAALLRFPFKVATHYFRRSKAPAILHLGDMAIWPLGLLSWLRRGKTRLLLTSHGTDVCYPRKGGLKGWLYGAYLGVGRLLLGRAAVLTNSHATAAETRLRGWQDTRIVPLATDFSAPVPSGSHDGSILFVGRLVERKGCSWFIRNVLPQLPPGTKLRVIGKAWDADEAAALATKGVDYLGAVSRDELISAFSSAMCVVMPNILPKSGDFEGFGIVAADAAACGGVVLASRCGGLADAVADGVSGFQLEPGDTTGWIAAIERVSGWSQAERSQFVTRSMAHVDANLRWPRVARDVAAIYARLGAS